MLEFVEMGPQCSIILVTHFLRFNSMLCAFQCIGVCFGIFQHRQVIFRLDRFFFRSVGVKEFFWGGSASLIIEITIDSKDCFNL